jgi:hypothetical protein
VRDFLRSSLVSFGTQITWESGLNRTAVHCCICLSEPRTLQTFCRILPPLDSLSALAPCWGCSFGASLIAEAALIFGTLLSGGTW